MGCSSSSSAVIRAPAQRANAPGSHAGPGPGFLPVAVLVEEPSRCDPPRPLDILAQKAQRIAREREEEIRARQLAQVQQQRLNEHHLHRQRQEQEKIHRQMQARDINNSKGQSVQQAQQIGRINNATDYSAQRQRQEAEHERQMRTYLAQRAQPSKHKDPAKVEKKQSEEAERKRKEEAERKRIEEAERVSNIYIQLVDSIDYYVRTRNKFDSSNPTAYRCGFSSILQDSDVIAAHRTLCSIPGYNTTALLTFVRNMSKDFKMHEDNYSNNIFVGVIKLTPGRKDRMFGYYKCSSCRRKWASSWSWMDKFQQCNKCNSKCYAYRRDQLRGEGTDEYKPHDQARCEKCREVGDCTRFR
jgi:hypothetical protein